ncbi:MAG: pilus assembly protein PilM [Desulfobacterales bacterium]|jgi:type II secretory pathway component PulL|nr:pilus assembly protein PilM [Desulfobacterales bacterium]
MTRKIISLDIRSDKISTLLIKTSLKGHSVEAVSSVPIPTLSEVHDESVNRFVAALENSVKGMDLSGAEFVISIPPNLISYRNLRVPFKDRKKIRQVLPFEIEPTLPFPVEEAFLDFQAVRQGDQTDIIVCAVRTPDLTVIVDALKSLDMDPQAVTAGGLPTALCLARFSNIATQYLFIDVDCCCCTLYAIISGQIHLVRTFQFDPSRTAEKYDVIFRQSLQFLAAFEAFYDFKFEPAILCFSGEGIDADVLKHRFDPVMEVSVQPVNILNDIMKSTRLADGLPYSPQDYNGALGMAALEIPGIDMINFYGERTLFKRYWEENKNDIIKTSGIALLVFIFFMFNVLLEARQLDKSIRSINQKMTLIFQSTFPDVAKIVDPVQQMRTKIQDIKEQTSYAGEIGDIKLNVDILNEISQLVPSPIDVEITQFVRGDDNILISGHTDTFNAVDEIKSTLEKSKLLKNITINSANLDAASNRVQFKMKVDF